MNDILRRSLAILLSWILVTNSFVVNADAISDAGRDAQQYGQDLISNFNTGNMSNNGGVITLPSMDSSTGQFNASNPTTIDINDLFPGTSNNSQTPITNYFPAAATPTTSDLQAVSQDADAMDDLGVLYTQELFTDANSANPTVMGQAYKTLMGRATLATPDLSNDPVLNVSKSVFDNIETIATDFADCTTNTVLSDITKTTRVPDYKYCERMFDQSQSCTVNHVYGASVIEHHSGPYNIAPVTGQNAIDLWIGEVGDNYWNGYCSVFEEVTEYRVTNPDAITKVTLVNAKWDDYIQIFVGPVGNETKIYNGPSSVFYTSYEDDGTLITGNQSNPFPPETAGNCELSTSWNKNLNIDVTNYFKNVTPGDVIRFKIRVSVAGAGEGYAKLRLEYDPKKTITQDNWFPQNCIDATKGLYDGFASGTVQCISMPVLDNDGCAFVDGVRICDGTLDPSPFPAITGKFSEVPSLCQQATVDVDYDYYKGEICWINAQGTETCAQSGINSDSCTNIEADPSCGFISSGCLDGAEADDGTCYVTEEKWDCGTDVEVNDIESTTTYDCVGEIRCMGSDCLDPESTQSSSFAETAAMLNAAQFMTQDMNCDPIDGTANVNCTVFGGKALDCKKAIGGLIDCCDLPTQVSLANYISALMSVAKLDTSLMAIQDGNAVVGAYQTIRSGVTNTLTEVTQPFTSYIENIAGEVVDFFEPVTTYMDNLKTEIGEAVSEIINDMIGDSAAASGSSAAAAVAGDQATAQTNQAATDSILNSMSGAAGAVMTAYMYYTVAVMVLEIIYECEEKEFELAAKRDLKSCNKIGSYCSQDTGFFNICLEKKTTFCCYNSPLARIISEQVAPQTGGNGTAKNPDCGGINVNELASLDWSLIDLSEWIALLNISDLAPDINGMTLDSLTGSGSALNINGNRSNAADRVLDRLDGTDVDEVRINVNNNTVIDPSGGL